MPVTITEIAKAAGVSVATVSRALTQSKHPMSEDTRQRIIRLADELGYQPNLVARSLRTDRTLTIGLIVENILSPFIPPIIRGVQDYLKPHGYFSIIINSDWDPDIETDAILAFNNRQIDGIIFVETWHRTSKRIREMTDKPFVFVHRVFNSHGNNSVVPDDLWGAHLAVEHLAKLGHRRIAFISGPKDWDASKNRHKGYQEELEQCGISYDPLLVEEGDWEVQGGYCSTQALMSKSNPPTAIFAGNDLMALGAIYALQQDGLRVPNDVAVVGYDNRNFTGFVQPAISTVTLPCYDMGEASARLLVQILKEEIEISSTLEVRGELIVRQSCGANMGSWNFEEEPGSIAWKSRRPRNRRC